MNTRVEINKRLAAVNTASSLAAQVLNISVLVWLQQHLLRSIPPEEYSLYPVLMSFMLAIPIVATMFAGGLRRYVTEAYAKGDDQRVGEIVSTTLLPLLGAAGLIAVVGGVFAYNVDRVLTVSPVYASDARKMMAMMVTLGVLRMALTPFTIGIYVRQKFFLQNLLMLGFQLLRLGLIALLFIFAGTHVIWVVTANLASECCSMIVQLVISRRLVPALRFRWDHIRWGATRQVRSFGLWTCLGQVAGLIRESADPIILNKLATPVDVTNFYLGSLGDKQIRMAAVVATEPLQPALTAMHAVGHPDQLRRAYLRGGRYALWMALILAVPLVVYRHELLQVYLRSRYSTYIETATVILLLSAAYPVSFSNLLMWSVASAKGQIRSLMIRAITVCSANLIASLVFVGVLRLGAVGSAMGAFLVTVICEPLLYWPLGLSLAGVAFSRWARETIGRGMLPALVATIVWVAMKLLLHPIGLASVGLCVATGCVVYGAVLVLGACTDEERTVVWRLLKIVCRRELSPKGVDVVSVRKD